MLSLCQRISTISIGSCGETTRARSKVLSDYRTTRLTSGASASSFTANTAVKQNAIEHQNTHAAAAAVVLYSFYVDDGLAGEDSVPEAATLQKELQELF